MRLPTKPWQTPTRTGTLPMRRPTVIAVAITVFDDFWPRTISSSRITLAGLKKCIPITLSGRFVADAISSTSSVEVLVASTASGLQMASSLANTSFLIGISSNTASMTMSASAAALKSTLPVISPIRFSTSAAVSRPREAVAS